MHKQIFANRFGLALSFILLSLFPSTTAWAQKMTATAGTQGPQQVVVANTTAQPIPMVGTVAEVAQGTPVVLNLGITFYGGTQTGTQATYSIPQGKRLIIDHFSTYCSSQGLLVPTDLRVRLRIGQSNLATAYVKAEAWDIDGTNYTFGGADQPIHAEFDTGSLLVTGVRNQNGGTVGCQANVIGKLINAPLAY